MMWSPRNTITGRASGGGPLVETPSVKLDTGSGRHKAATTTHQPQPHLLAELLPWEDQPVPRKRPRPLHNPAPLEQQQQQQQQHHFLPKPRDEKQQRALPSNRRIVHWSEHSHPASLLLTRSDDNNADAAASTVALDGPTILPQYIHTGSVDWVRLNRRQFQELADIEQVNDDDGDLSCSGIVGRSPKRIQGTMELRSSRRSCGRFQNNNLNADAGNQPNRFEEEGQKRLPSFDDIERDNWWSTSPVIEYNESNLCLPLYTRMCLRLDRLIAEYAALFPSLDEHVRIATLRLFDNIDPDQETFQALVKLDQDARQRLVDSAGIYRGMKVQRYFNGKIYDGTVVAECSHVYDPTQRQMVAVWKVEYADDCGDTEVLAVNELLCSCLLMMQALTSVTHQFRNLTSMNFSRFRQNHNSKSSRSLVVWNCSAVSSYCLRGQNFLTPMVRLPCCSRLRSRDPRICKAGLGCNIGRC
jgi:hypothetical protein